MPKIVDHAERRREIAAALWRVIARDGMTGASARSVAAEAGWSLGSVRYYFSTQQALLHFAAEAMFDAIGARARTIVQDLPPGPARSRILIEQLLPLDTQRTGEVRAWLAVLVEPDDDPFLTTMRDTAWRDTRRLSRMVVADQTGQPPPPSDDTAWSEPLEAEAASLHAWIDGLTLQSITVPDRFSTDQLQHEIDRRLQSITDLFRP
ncbi:TetR/AcrR family transcriptional regulator [Aeromicrobium sp. CF3.5]|uniref:TetR/AcrR family transcriptional regulator n=1 Tax=Aeromicrobium sp. CF3.5 TaxID=3373078 RepID=UPI003EE457B3